MEAIRLGEGRSEVDELFGRVEAGETIDIVRDGRVVAKVVPVEPSEVERVAPHPSWKEAGFDWDEVRRFAATLKYDPTNSVEEMRMEARY